jgi:heterodisulfide reductase subunit A-like polyferredoxin
MPGNEQEAAFMCACCSDCCGMLSVIKNFPTPGYMVASNYYAQVNADLCQGTATCVQRCPMDAVKLEDGIASVDLARCIGCGVCVPTCRQKAIVMVQKSQETIPPQTQEELYDKLLAGRQSQ